MQKLSVQKKIVDQKQKGNGGNYLFFEGGGLGLRELTLFDGEEDEEKLLERDAEREGDRETERERELERESEPE